MFPFLIAPMAVYNDNSASGWIRNKNRGFLLLEHWTSAHHHCEIASISCMLAVLDTWQFWIQWKLFEDLLLPAGRFYENCCQRLQSAMQYICSKNELTQFLIEPGICYRYTTMTVGALRQQKPKQHINLIGKALPFFLGQKRGSCWSHPPCAPTKHATSTAVYDPMTIYI